MGVIYKLKQEVIDFIVSKKNSEPRISCRKLAEVTSENFSLYVSKSSVNTVLKKAKLSSGVGRRTKEANAPKAFYIPRKKKEQIQKDLKRSSLVAQKEIKKEKISSPPVSEELLLKKKEPLLPHVPIISSLPPKEKPRSLTETSGHGPEKPKEEPLSPTIRREAEKAVLSIDQDPSLSSGEVVSHLGCIFIKAAQWMLSAEGLLGEFVHKFTAQPTPENIERIANTTMFLRKFPRPNQIHPENWGPIAVNMFSQTKKDPLKSCFQKPLQSLNKQIVEFASRMASLSLMVAGFQIILENDQNLYFDAELCSCRKRLANIANIPILQALSFLSKNIASNNLPICLHSEGKGQGTDNLEEFISFANQEKGFGIKKVLILGKNCEKIANFSVFPFQKRNFIIGFLQDNKNYEILTKSAKWAKKNKYLCKNTNISLFFTDMSSDFMINHTTESKKEHRVINLWGESKERPPLALLTNDTESSPETLISHYLKRWPERIMKDSLKDAPEQSKFSEEDPLEAFMNISEYSLKCLELGQFDLVGCFWDFLERYAAKWFFEEPLQDGYVNEMISMCYDIPGVLEERTEAILVRLKINKKSPYFSKAYQALRKINNFNILDSLGRRLIITTELTS